MIRHPTLRVMLSVVCAAFLTTSSPLHAQVAPAAEETITPATPGVATSAVSSPDLVLLEALRSNPVTAPYRIGISMQGGRVVLSGKVGTKYVHDVAVRIAIDLGYPFRDNLVIDTNEAHRVAAFPVVPTIPVAGPLVGIPPYLYPPPLFGRLDDPFYGMEPPLISYPPWWPAVAGRRQIDPAALGDAGPHRRSRCFGPRRGRPDSAAGDGRDDDRPAWARDPSGNRPYSGGPDRDRPEDRTDTGRF